MTMLSAVLELMNLEDSSCELPVSHPHDTCDSNY